MKNAKVTVTATSYFVKVTEISVTLSVTLVTSGKTALWRNWVIPKSQTMLLQKRSKCPITEKKWTESELLQLDEDDGPNIYQSAFKLTTDTKIQTFQFKITHRILASKANLYIWQN